MKSIINKKNKKKYKISLKNVLNFYYKKLKLFSNKKKKLRVGRDEKISKSITFRNVYIHQGHTWIKLKLTEYHVGYKFGEFSCTRKPFLFRPKNKKIKKR